MGEVSRLSAEQVREGLVARTTLLVCAYEDSSKFDKFKLERAGPLSDFKVKMLEYQKDMQIVFYCVTS